MVVTTFRIPHMFTRPAVVLRRRTSRPPVPATITHRRDGRCRRTPAVRPAHHGTTPSAPADPIGRAGGGTAPPSATVTGPALPALFGICRDERP